MTKKLFIAVLILVVLTPMLRAQQVPLYQQYFYNPFVYNPAYAGSSDAANVFLIHRAQWSDIPGQPLTTAITFDGPLKPKKIGLGVNLYSDKTDITSRVGVYGSFAYNIGIGDDQNLMFGLSIGGLQNRIDFTKVVVKDIDDPFLLASVEQKQGLDGTFGIAYRWKELNFGLAIPQILASSFEFTPNLGSSRSTYNLSRHFMGSLDYNFYVNANKDIALKPMVLVRFMPEAPMQFDANLIFNWRETAFLAVSYRSDYAIGVNARVKLKEKISIGYTYDVITSSINTFSGISHEILLGFTFAGGEKKVDKSELKELQQRIDSLAGALAANQAEIDARYDELIAEADSLFEAGKYEEARSAYEQALALKPDEQYPKDKIAEIDSMKNSQYDDAIARADALFKNRDYEGAKRAYEEALRHKPGDEYAQDRLNKTNKIISLFAKRYNTLIKAADSLFMAKEYKLAREQYVKASEFNPNSKYPKEMIALIDNNQTGGDIRMVRSEDFLDEFGNTAAKGFYVVMASFKSKDYAERMKAEKGYKSVYNKVRGFHYVYMTMEDSYDSARSKLMNKARKEKADSWIYILR
ncbi:MAG: PorP/SprF family type IX secretion system membrane protein [Flavobacteriales bacterium]|nr:PorP/SprF family type IX secretion system membrane protein [Flavobacteriales bacterium]